MRVCFGNAPSTTGTKASAARVGYWFGSERRTGAWGHYVSPEQAAENNLGDARNQVTAAYDQLQREPGDRRSNFSRWQVPGVQRFQRITPESHRHRGDSGGTATRRSQESKREMGGWGWFPDSTRFLVACHPSTEEFSEWNSDTTSIWSVSAPAGTPTRLRDHAVLGSVSPDGSQVHSPQTRASAASANFGSWDRMVSRHENFTRSMTTLELAGSGVVSRRQAIWIHPDEFVGRQHFESRLELGRAHYHIRSLPIERDR